METESKKNAQNTYTTLKEWVTNPSWRKAVKKMEQV